MQHQDQRKPDEDFTQRGELHRLEAGHKLGGKARCFQKDHDRIGAEHGAAWTPDAAGRDGEEDVDRDQRLEVIGRDVGLEMRIKRTRQRRDRCRCLLYTSPSPRD